MFTSTHPSSRPLPPRTDSSRDSEPGAVHGTPRVWLRLEGAATVLVALAGYGLLGGSWGWFAAGFLLPDLALLGYLAGPRSGALAYNVTHSFVGPAALLLVGLGSGTSLAVLVAIVWIAHIGFDRMLGYGLKYADGFTQTHLGRIGAGTKASSLRS